MPRDSVPQGNPMEPRDFLASLQRFSQKLAEMSVHANVTIRRDAHAQANNFMRAFRQIEQVGSGNPDRAPR